MVYDLCLKAAQSSGFPAVSYGKLTQGWADFCPDINIMKPSVSTVPAKCGTSGSVISLAEDEKSQRLEDFQKNLDHNKAQRKEVYKVHHELDEGKKPVQPANSEDVAMHGSFDHLQQVHHPIGLQQAG